MLPATLTTPLRVYAGDNFSKTFTFLNGSDQTPINLTGRTFRCQWRSTPTTEDAVEFGIDSSQAALGKITISLSIAQTAALADGVWDLQSIVTAGGVVETLIRGTVAWTKDVTRV